MYSPHKKCYEGYETLMGSVRRVVMGRFKREGKKNRRIGSYTGKQKILRNKRRKRRVPG